MACRHGLSNVHVLGGGPGWCLGPFEMPPVEDIVDLQHRLNAVHEITHRYVVSTSSLSEQAKEAILTIGLGDVGGGPVA